MITVSGSFSERVAASPSRALNYLPATAFLLDLLLISAASAMAALGRSHLPFFDSPLDIDSSLTVVIPTLASWWMLLLWALGAYRTEVFGAGGDEYKRVVNAGVYAAALLGITCYLAKYDLSRGFFLLAFAIGVPAVLGGRMLLRHLLKRLRAKGVLQERVTIVGGPAHVDEIATVLRRERWLGYSIQGAVVPSAYDGEETPGGVPVTATVDRLSTLPDHVGETDILFITGGAHYSSVELRKLAWDLEHEHVQLVVAPSVTDVASERVRVRPVGGLPLVHLEGPRSAQAIRWAKRTFDLLGGCLLILLSLPVLLFAAIRVKAYDGGPVFFRQTRIGRDGREFSCLKFRTMVVGADKMLSPLLAEGANGALFKMRVDPRVTRPGRWLRRYSIDELPQLFNVVRGDMSLIGPRPPLPREVAAYDDRASRRLRVRPGMTGLWQVSGRSDLAYDEAIRLDLYYVDNWSMVQDLSILWRTFGAVLAGRGAY